FFIARGPSASGCAVCFRSRVRKRTRADRDQCQKLPKTFRECQLTCSADRNCLWMKRCGRGSSTSAERDFLFREFGNVWALVATFGTLQSGDKNPFSRSCPVTLGGER